MYRNRSVFSTRSARRSYGVLSGLTPAEWAALALCDTGGRVLDLGIGGGRTTAALLPLCRGYVGVDYAAPMVALCRGRFGGAGHATFLEADAAELGGLADGSFDVVVFSYNGIDYVAHGRRLMILAEVRRVLAPGGRFVFSTHNRGFAGVRPRPVLRRPLRWRGVARTGVEWLNWARHRGAERSCAEYALVNDAAHLFQLVTYCIGRAAQVGQLEGAGFRVVAVLGPDGTAAVPGADGAAASLHFVAEAPA